jgi:hypothetical protein
LPIELIRICESPNIVKVAAGIFCALTTIIA